jgi:hypothetical protein
MADSAGMALELKSTRGEFDLSDKSGYKFKVVTTQQLDGDRQGAWAAEVTFSTDGFKTDEAAVLHLLAAGEHFVRMLKEARDEGV